MRLFLLRHAKTKQFSDTGLDFDRELKTKGKKQSELMANYLAKHFKKDSFTIVHSPAKRTTQTFKRIKDGISIESYSTDKSLYLPTLNEMLHFVWNRKDEENLMLIGHNFGISELASYFLDDFIDLPTCGLVVIEFEIEHWNESSKGAGLLANQYYPQILD